MSPAQFGLPTHPLDHVRSGSAAENAAVARFLFAPASHTQAVPKGALAAPLTFTASDGTQQAVAAGTHVEAILDYVLLQTAALLYVGGKSGTLSGAVELARASLRHGGAANALAQLARHAVTAAAEEQREEAEIKRSSRKDDYYYASRSGLKNGAPASS